jgi:hypothetical protein
MPDMTFSLFKKIRVNDFLIYAQYLSLGIVKSGKLSRNQTQKFVAQKMSTLLIFSVLSAAFLHAFWNFQVKDTPNKAVGMAACNVWASATGRHRPII